MKEVHCEIPFKKKKKFAYFPVISFEIRTQYFATVLLPIYPSDK